MPRDGITDGPVETLAPQQRARFRTKPTEASPAAASHPVATPERGRAKRRSNPIYPTPGLADIQIGSATKPVRKGRAKAQAKPMASAPSPEPFGAGAINGPEPSMVTPRSPIPILVDEYRIRRFAIKGQQYCDRTTESLIASFLGFNPEADQKTRKAVFAKAATIRVGVEKTASMPPGLFQPHVHETLIAIIQNSAQNRMSWDISRAKAEKHMIELAKSLPVHPWQKTITGFGEIGLAILTAEAAGIGNIPISEYRTVSGLWKRMGLAVIDGQRQRRVADKEAGIAHGYNPERRAACWALADSLFRLQMCSEIRSCRQVIAEDYAASTACAERGIDLSKKAKIEQLRPIVDEFGLAAQQTPTGPYGEVYVRRQRHTTPRIEATEGMPPPLVWTPLRCHKDAVRVMFKELLKDLWVEWRRVDSDRVLRLGCIER